jgi:hypothetical protein
VNTVGENDSDGAAATAAGAARSGAAVISGVALSRAGMSSARLAVSDNNRRRIANVSFFITGASAREGNLIVSL